MGSKGVQLPKFEPLTLPLKKYHMKVNPLKDNMVFPFILMNIFKMHNDQQLKHDNSYKHCLEN
jgi:hypothetical protein